MIQHFVGPNGHSLATSQNIIAWNVTRAEAFLALSKIEGVDPDAVFNSNVDALTFKATVASALANETMFVAAAIDSMADRTEAERLHGRLDLLLKVTEELRSEQERQNGLAEQQLAERKAASDKVEREHRACVAREAAAKQAEVDRAEAARRAGRKLQRFVDGSADLLDISSTPHRVIRRWKPGEPIPAEYL